MKPALARTKGCLKMSFTKLSCGCRRARKCSENENMNLLKVWVCRTNFLLETVNNFCFRFKVSPGTRLSLSLARFSVVGLDDGTDSGIGLNTNVNFGTEFERLRALRTRVSFVKVKQPCQSQPFTKIWEPFRMLYKNPRMWFWVQFHKLHCSYHGREETILRLLGTWHKLWVTRIESFVGFCDNFLCFPRAFRLLYSSSILRG